jgi:hypothetical protein
LIATLVEGILRYFRQEATPVGRKAIASFSKAGRRSVSMLARMKAGVEAASPSQLIDIDRNARALANRADMDVVVIDVPYLVMGVVRAAAGEGGHVANSANSGVQSRAARFGGSG